MVGAAFRRRSVAFSILAMIAIGSVDIDCPAQLRLSVFISVYAHAFQSGSPGNMCPRAAIGSLGEDLRFAARMFNSEARAGICSGYAWRCHS